MDFSNPIALSWLGLALPIIALYLIKRKAVNRQVSTLIFWQTLQQEEQNRALWRKLRQWVSLFLQILLLTLLAAALARPFFANDKLSDKRILVLDRSASMAASDTWQRTLQVLSAELRSLGSGEQAILLTTTSKGAQVLHPWTISRTSLLEAAKATVPDTAPHSLGAAIQLARELSSEHDNAPITVLSDGVVSPLAEAINAPGTSTDKLYLPLKPRKHINAGITQFHARRSNSIAGEYTLQAEVAAPADSPLKGELNRYLDNRLVHVKQLDLSAGETWQHSWQQHSDKLATVRLELLLKGQDDWAIDNQAQLVITPLENVNVYLAGEPHPFLIRALESLQAVNILPMPATPINQAPSKDTSHALYIFCNITPPDNWQQPSILINPQVSGFWGQAGKLLEYPIIASQNEVSPLLRHVQLLPIRIHKAQQFRPPPLAETLASTPENSLIFSRWDDRSQWLLIPFNLADSDLMLRTAFPILLGNVIQALRGSEDTFSAPLPGLEESRLQANDDIFSEQAQTGSRQWLAGLPLWWWLTVMALLWCCAEWWSFTRKVSE